MLHKTGGKAPAGGHCEFVMHLDGTMKCAGGERRIHLEKGDTFPPHRSCGKACYWGLAE
ncbi:MAG: YjzC family protein [Firmicutes bacterium]|nr:YjzC family protein [Bacillota bacterium]